MALRNLKILSCEHSLPFFKKVYNAKPLSLKKSCFSFKKIDKRYSFYPLYKEQNVWM